MNKKQKNVIGLAAVLVVGKLLGGIQIAYQLGAWDIFMQKTINSWPYYAVIIVVALVLIGFFDTKP